MWFGAESGEDTDRVRGGDLKIEAGSAQGFCRVSLELKMGCVAAAPKHVLIGVMNGDGANDRVAVRKEDGIANPLIYMQMFVEILLLTENPRTCQLRYSSNSFCYE